MNSNKRILAAVVAVVFAFVASSTGLYAASYYGTASIGFSNGVITYIPGGISGVESTLNLEFGTHNIGSSNMVEVYRSLNKAGYVVSNESGGAYGYTVTVGLSSFDRGLEGATLTLYPDSQGLVSNVPGAQNPPIFRLGMSGIELEADGLSSMVVMEGTRYSQDPTHAGLGRWGFNFIGDLKVYTNTILAGRSRAIMTWEITIA